MTDRAGEAERPATRRSLGRATYTLVTAGAISKGALLLAEFALARAVGTEAFGYFAVSTSLVIVISSIALLGYDQALVQAWTSPASTTTRNRSALAASLIVVGFVTGLAAVTVVALSAPLTSLLLDEGTSTIFLKAAAIAFVFESLNNVLAAALRADGRFGTSVTVFDGTRNLGLLAVAAYLLLGQGSSAEHAILVYAGGSALGTLIGSSALFIRGSRTKLDIRPALTDLWHFARPLSVWSVIQLSSTQFYVVLAGALLAPQEVGALAIGLRIVVLLNFLRTAVTASAQPEFARLSQAGNSEGLEKVLQRSSLALFVGSSVLILPFLLDPGAVMAVFGPTWTQYSWILWPLLLPKLINVIGGPVGQLLIASGHGSTMLKLSLIEVVLQLGILIPLMAWHGLAGAIAGEAIRVAVMTSLRHLAVHRKLKIGSITSGHLRVLGALSAALLIGHLLNRWVEGSVGVVCGVTLALAALELVLRLRPSSTPTPLGMIAGALSFLRSLPSARRTDRTPREPGKG